MNSVDKIIRAEKSVEANLASLYLTYIKDYGYNNFDEIKNRMNNTYYLFESNPIRTHDFIHKNKFQVKDSLLYLQIEAEYIDYKKKRKKIMENLDKVYNKVLCDLFPDDSYDISVFENIDCNPFNSRLENLLNGNISLDEKKDLLCFRELYIDYCKRENKKIIDDIEAVETLTNLKKDYTRSRIRNILRETIWGKRIYNDIKKKIPWFTIRNYTDFILSGSDAIAHVTYVSNGKRYRRLLYLPLISREFYGNLDKLFYHENRHIVESSTYATGISNLRDNKYNLINEIKTDLNAVNDSKNHDNIIFKKEKRKGMSGSSYLDLLPYTGNFFDKYLEFLNECSFNGDFEKLENEFGKDNLLEFESFLEETMDLISYKFSDKLYEDRIEKGYQFVKKMSN